MIDVGAPILILTGAGISAESGLQVFRGAGGLWEGHRLEEVATPEAFRADPDLVQRFYNARRAQLQDAAVQPNAAHDALVRLQRTWPGPVTLVTQNVDDLHERAGFGDVVHMHGELNRVRCLACAAEQGWREDVSADSRCATCGAAGRLRPAIVWFGEMPLAMDLIAREIGRAALFVSIGTSGVVYPAAGFVAEARALGRAHCLEINLEPSDVRSQFHEARHGPASRLVPAWVDEMLDAAGLA
ncbi:MAG: NAD-dependent deacylase [Pseudomonadota bacterium]